MPVTSLFGYDITGFIGSSIFIEYIFSYPGIGRLFISSLESRDFSVIVVLLLTYGLAALVGTLVSDIILTIADPIVVLKNDPNIDTMSKNESKLCFQLSPNFF